ncbi:uncharacterized protein CLUP02_13137 [Colletotrichum lupini]|uniref:Uncharacterized protein n=1 Tax=Colletotrichum lupini TaxID=145971 RepID=A0A9Q8T1R3_9PEZI|nr:uncharacterized protein CLUP02_13137 [Colletotrichum lupini]UQC87619.1 hypothetical protein CLUP02_13137 [Colletotrichum lupini]
MSSFRDESLLQPRATCLSLNDGTTPAEMHLHSLHARSMIQGPFSLIGFFPVGFLGNQLPHTSHLVCSHLPVFPICQPAGGLHSEEATHMAARPRGLKSNYYENVCDGNAAPHLPYLGRAGSTVAAEKPTDGAAHVLGKRPFPSRRYPLGYNSSWQIGNSSYSKAFWRTASLPQISKRFPQFHLGDPCSPRWGSFAEGGPPSSLLGIAVRIAASFSDASGPEDSLMTTTFHVFCSSPFQVFNCAVLLILWHHIARVGFQWDGCIPAVHHALHFTANIRFEILHLPTIQEAKAPRTLLVTGKSHIINTKSTRPVCMYQKVPLIERGSFVVNQKSGTTLISDPRARSIPAL